MIDENVREWRGGVCDVGHARESSEQLPYEVVDLARRYLVLDVIVSVAILVRERPVDAGVGRGLVGFVVDDQDGKVFARCRGDLLEPFDEPTKDGGVLLGDDESGLTARQKRCVHGAGREVALQLGGGESDPARALRRNRHATGFAADQLTVQPPLCLLSKLVVYTGENDEQAIASVGRLGDQGAVVGCLSTLNVADNQPPCVKWRGALRILEHSENAIRSVIDGLYRSRRPAPIDQELLTQSGPIQPLLPIHIAQPLLMIALSLDHPQISNLHETLVVPFSLQRSERGCPQLRRDEWLACDRILGTQIEHSHCGASQRHRVLKVHPPNASVSSSKSAALSRSRIRCNTSG